MHSFKKEERLCSIKLIEELYHNGSSFLLYPYRVTWLPGELPAGMPVRILIGAPKKRFKRAVDRNLIKRRIREIYRLQKSELLYPFLNQHSMGLILAVNYIGNDIADYAFMEKKFKVAIEKLKKACLEKL